MERQSQYLQGWGATHSKREGENQRISQDVMEMNKSQHPETACFTIMGQSPTGSTALPSLCSNLGVYSLIFSQNQTQGPHLRVSPSRWGSPQLADHPQSLFPSVEKQLKKRAGPPASGPKSDLLTGGSAEQEVFPDSPERPNMKPLPTWKSDRLKHQALCSKEKSLTLDNVPSTGGTGFSCLPGTSGSSLPP